MPRKSPTPRPCHLCGAMEIIDADNRDMHGKIKGRLVCGNCWPTAIARYKQGKAAAGLAFWRERGVVPGQAVRFQLGSFYGPALAVGIAKVGADGAYIHCARYGARKICPTAFAGPAVSAA